MGPTSREDFPQKLQVVTRLPRKPPWELPPEELPPVLDPPPGPPVPGPPGPPGGMLLPPPLPVRLGPAIGSPSFTGTFQDIHKTNLTACRAIAHVIRVKRRTYSIPPTR